MRSYSFTLVIDGDVDSHLDELFDAGCDDATFGSVDGTHYADFDRRTGTLAEAITSAIKAIESVPALRVLHVEPDDLVTASEIADRLHRTRESIRLIAAGRRGTKPFPRPISHLRRRSRLWRWSDVRAWADDDPEELSTARIIAALNAALELRSTSFALPEEARTLLGPVLQ